MEGDEEGGLLRRASSPWGLQVFAVNAREGSLSEPGVSERAASSQVERKGQQERIKRTGSEDRSNNKRVFEEHRKIESWRGSLNGTRKHRFQMK